jgi:inorganic pyrophosphatase/exopolyphosphatase
LFFSGKKNQIKFQSFFFFANGTKKRNENENIEIIFQKNIVLYSQSVFFKKKKKMRSLLNSSSKKPIAYILGNEGGDMDSVVCAFMLSRLIARYSSTNNTSPTKWLENLKHHHCVPVCNFPRSDLSLRQDIILAFKKSQIIRDEKQMLDELAFLDEVPFLLNDETTKQKEEEKEKKCILLVDHNIPAPNQMHLVPFVKGIVDHHALPPQPIKFSNDEEFVNVIETIGSASSLITRLFATLNIPINKSEAYLLLCPILMDTNNFNPASKKAVEGDFHAADFLYKIISSYSSFGTSSSFGAKEATALFDELAHARESYELLSIADALKKDTKVFHFEFLDKKQQIALPIASWGENLEKHVLKRFSLSQILDELVNFANDYKGAQSDGAMAMFHKKHERHVIFYARTPACQKAVKAFFDHHRTENQETCKVSFQNLSESWITKGNLLTEEERKKYPLEQFGVFLFDDHTVSRKGFTPILFDFFGKYSL